MVKEEKNGDRVRRHSAMGKVGWVRGGRGEKGYRLKGNDITRNHRGISAAPTSERVQLEESILFIPLPPTTRRGSPDTEQRQRFYIVPRYR